MHGILLLTQTEIRRLRRNRRYLIFTVGLPVVLYLLWAMVRDRDELQPELHACLRSSHNWLSSAFTCWRWNFRSRNTT